MSRNISSVNAFTWRAARHGLRLDITAMLVGEGDVYLDSNIRHEPLLFVVERIYIFSPVLSVFRVPFISSFTVLRHDLRGIRMKSDAVAFYVSSSFSSLLPPPCLGARHPLACSALLAFVIFSLPTGETERREGWARSRPDA